MNLINKMKLDVLEKELKAAKKLVKKAKDIKGLNQLVTRLENKVNKYKEEVEEQEQLAFEADVASMEVSQNLEQ